MTPVVFIHSNAVQSIAAEVAAGTLKARSRRPGAFEVRVVRLEETPHLYRREGERYVSGDRRLVWRNRDANSHGPLRMMVPQLMGYRGRALSLDPDIFAVGDVTDLLERDMGGRSIVCRRKPRRSGAPAHYYSSVMLLDCEKLTHWKWDQAIDDMFRERLDPDRWLTLELEAPSSIGPLEDEWNDRDTLSARTRLLHNTRMRTQPWKTGLPIDFDLNHIGAELLVRRSDLARVRERATRAFRLSTRSRVYRRHPDPRQERYFFSLLRQCIDRGEIAEEIVRMEIQKGHLRPDAFELINAADPSG